MKKVLISSFDMEVGGVERSLISMLKNFDYAKYEVDLMLYRHQGAFMKYLPNKVNLLNEMDGYNTFGVPILNLIKNKKFPLAVVRIVAKVMSMVVGYLKKVDEIAYYQAQLMRKFSMPYLSNLEKEYDIAISYVWPHYFIADKVKAKKKVAWIHTDYSTVFTNINMDLKMWSCFDHIISISQDCTNAFVKKYPELENRVVLMENISSPDFVKEMSKEEINEDLKEDNIFNIVTVGRISFAKGIDNAVKALKLLQDRGLTNIKWYVVGEGPQEKDIRELIDKLKLRNDFILLGKKINPYPYMKNCDLYVQSSRYEGKAISITEAQILGKPVLVTNYPTAKSQVRDQIDGMITELSIEGIANGIENLIRNNKLREKLIKNTSTFDYSNTYELDKLYKLID